MIRFALPDDIESFDDELLKAQLATINHLAKKATTEEALARTAPVDDDGQPTGVSGLEYAKSLAEAKTTVAGLLETRQAEAAEAEAERAAVLAALADDPEPEAGDDDSDDSDDSEDEVDTPTEAVVETVEPEPTVDDTPEPEAVETVEVDVPDVEVPDTPAEIVEQETVSAASAPKDTAAALRNMSARRTPAEQPQPRDSSPSGRLRAVGSYTPDGWRAGQFLNDPDEVHQYLTKQLREIGSASYDGPRDPVTLITSRREFNPEFTLSGTDVERNFEVFQRAASTYSDSVNANAGAATLEALVAAGAPCAPLVPSYDFDPWYSPQRPIESVIPTVDGERGGIKYLDQSRNVTESAAGVTTKTAAEAALEPGDGGYAAKNCTVIPCPSETSVVVGLSQWCVKFDNLRFRVFPEFVAKVLRDLAIEYTKAKEVGYIDQIDTFAGAAVDIAAALAGLGTPAPNPYGAGRSLFYDLVTAGHNYRKRENMAWDAMLDVWLPTSAEQSLLIDTVNDPNMSAVGTITSGPNGNLTQVLAQRARMNVHYYYYDGTDVAWPASEHSDAAGAWNPLPFKVRSFIHAPGAVVRVDSGELNLGVYRDSSLNADNYLEMFAEQWHVLANPGAPIVAHDHELCYSGVGPLHVAAQTCPDPEA